MWEKIKVFFKDSEVIFWSRLQALLGVICGAVTYVDPTILQPLFTPQGFTVGSSRVDLQACKLEYSIVSPK